MITKITETASLSGVKSPLLPLIYSDFLFPENECDGAYFQSINNENTLLLSLKGSTANVIKITDDYDIDELLSFLKFSHITNLVSELIIDDSFKSCHLYKACDKSFDADACCELNGGLNSEVFKGVHRLLSDGKGEFAYWYPDFTRRLNNGVAKGVCLLKNGEVLSCAVCPSVWENSAVIGGVATDKTCYKKGYASACVNKLVNLLLGCNAKNIYLWCSDENCGFYEKLGFINQGYVYISEDF